MSKAPSPLLGFNNNVRHKGRIFHIQTEDSGVKHPHVITHLFMDGGRILKTQKTSYADQLGEAGMAETVRTLMKQQHKAMFVSLRDGLYDELVERKAKDGSQPAMTSVNPPRKSVAPPPPPVPTEAEPIAEPPPAEASVEVAPLSEAEPMTTRDAPIELDVEAIERAAAAASRDDGRTSIHPAIAGTDLPPPPPEVLAKPRGGGGYREVTTPDPRREHGAKPPSVVPPPPRERGSGGAKRTSAQPPAAAGKYAVSRPASIFSSNRPPEGRSIFGEDLISEKSLDEVILSYLAEDLDVPPPKK